MTIYTFQRQFPPQVISNFTAGDLLDFSAFNMADFEQLGPFITYGGGDSFIILKFGGVVESLRVDNYTISAADFVFNESPDDLTVLGTTSIDHLFGGDGNDIFRPNGGGTSSVRGNSDWMLGGNGDDIYFVRKGADMIVERIGEGFDHVAVSSAYSLSAGQEIELLTTTSATATSSISLYGNELSQTIIGNAGNNQIADSLSGLPGGADVLKGLGGNDTYEIRNKATTVLEAVNGGSDRILAAVDYVLAPGVKIEFIGPITPMSTVPIKLTGNEFDQVLRGNDANNVLNGSGGKDEMEGQDGNDIYYVDNAGDRVYEDVFDGTDRAATSVSWTLTGEIELFTTTSLQGTKNINLTGNNFNQKINGNAGNNILDGSGGIDILLGYLGNDAFRLNRGGTDTILDYGVGDDHFEIRNLTFGVNLPLGEFRSNLFRANTTGLAEDNDDCLIYDTVTGEIFYDFDGVGGTDRLQLATVVGAPSLDYTDFIVVA